MGPADLGNVDLSDVHNLSQGQLDEACGKPRALPVGLNLDKPCPMPRPVMRAAKGSELP
jgi:hypothetical protein